MVSISFNIPSATLCNESFNLLTFSPTLVFKNYIAVDMKWYFTVVLIFIFLMTNGIEKLFMSLLNVCMSSIKTFFCQGFCPSLLSFFLNCWVLRILHEFWILDPYQKNNSQIFSTILWVVFFTFLIVFFDRWKLLILKYISSFFLLLFMFSVLYLRICCLIQSHKDL